MNKFILILLFIIVPAAVYAEEPNFFSMLQDIPLMKGLEEIEGETFSFDKPEGRIIQSSAYMHGVTKEEVLNFYQITLPQFGWGQVSENQFFRKSEFLEIDFEKHNPDIYIMKIMIKPTL